MDPNWERLAERLEADPCDVEAFEGLERHHQEQAAWPELVALYERRLEGSDLDAVPRQRAALLFRLGQVLEERCLELGRAIECYQDVARFAADYRPALVQLRRIYCAREQWDLALQVAEVEAGLDLEPWERAVFHAELGDLWQRRLGEAEQGLDHFERALAIDPALCDALLGKARCCEALGRHPEAAAALERALEQLGGPDRAPALVALARLVGDSLGDAARAEELWRRALSEDPKNLEALDALVGLASRKAQWELVVELHERRFALTAGALRRLAIAHEAANVWLERLNNAQGARLWLRRALELFPQDPVTHLALAEVERGAGNREALAEHLGRAVELAGDQAPDDAVRECAQLARERGDHEAARVALERLMTRAPDDASLITELGEVLAALGRDGELAEVLERQAALGTSATQRAAIWVRLAALQEERLADPDSALASYQRALELEPWHPEAERALERLYRKREDWPRLGALLERAAGHASGRRAAELHCALGELQLEQHGDADAARNAFQAARTADPGFERAAHGLERAALADGDEDALLEAFEREASVTTDPERIAFLVRELVRIREERGENDEAHHWAERWAAAAPDSRDALETRARLEEALGLDAELVETLARLDPLLSGDGRLAARRRRARLQLEAGDVDGARGTWRAAVQNDPRDLESLDALAELLEGDAQRAELAEIERRRAEGLEGAARIAPLARRAALLDALGENEAALEALDEVEALGDTDPENEDRRLALLERAGRFEELQDRLAARSAQLPEGDLERSEIDQRRAHLQLRRLARPEVAAELLRALHQRDPDDAEIGERLEEALRESGDLAGLARLMESRAARAPSAEAGAALQLEAAKLYEACEDEASARAGFGAATTAGGEVGHEATERLAALLERVGDFPALRELLENHLPDPAHATAHHERLAAICRDRLRDRRGAIEHLEAVVEAEPGRADVWQQLATLYEAEERGADLARALEQQLEAEPDDAEHRRLLHARLAHLYRDELDHSEGAIRHFSALHQLDPGDAEAGRYLAERFEGSDRSDALCDVLERQLAALPPQTPEATGLRLRIAGVKAQALGDVEGAIACLEPAAASPETLLAVAGPLADLYAESERETPLEDLARRAASVATDPGERASWSLRLADALRARGANAAAAEAYRQVLADRSEDREARSALRVLYAQLGETDSLARLLEAELARAAGAAEIPLRIELADAMQELARPGDALVQLRRVLELDPRDGEALERSLELAKLLGRHEEQLALLDRVLTRRTPRAERARRLAERAELLGGPLERSEEAAEALRAALALEPRQSSWRRSLRGLLERSGDWDGVLECLEAEARQHDGPARVALLDEAARVAAEHVSGETALPWLERVRAARPDDAGVIARIADVHRDADRPEPLLQAIEAELALGTEPMRRRALQLERAGLCERLGLVGRAIEALRDARAADPRDRSVLEEMARLAGASGRASLRAEALEALCAGAQGEERARLQRELAALQRGPLGEPERAAETLWKALGEPGALPGSMRIELLRELAATLRGAGRLDLWARAAEAELACLDPEAEVFTERRRTLHRELALAYDGPLLRPERALGHWRALVDTAAGAGLGAGELPEQAERALLAGLRRAAAHVELERRLRARLARDPGDRARWSELARLRAERLHRPRAAAEAWQQVLELEPGAVEALRGWRAAAERLGDWEAVASLLERELALPGERNAAERAALQRRLGEVAWHELGATTRASRAFAAALEAEPHDLVSLRELEGLCEAMEDWRGAIDFTASEIEVLGEREPERRREAWLRIATLANDRLDATEEALEAYARAHALEPLGAEQLADWAELHARGGNTERFVEIYAAWCDHPESRAGSDELLRLAGALGELGRPADARARLERAVELDPERADALEALADRCEKDGDAVAAAAALASAAALERGPVAAGRNRRAALLLEPSDAVRACELLEAAASEDPASLACHVDLARLAATAARPELAQRAAERVLDLTDDPERLADPGALEAALAGARAASERGRDAVAERLFAAARRARPDHPEALEGHAAALLALGESGAAREALEARLALPAQDAERATLLCRLGRCLLELDSAEAALDRFIEALEADPGCDDAYAGQVEVLEQLARSDDAVAALRAWAECAPRTAQAGARLLRAAEIEAAREGREQAALDLLGEARIADPASASIARRRVEALRVAGRDAELLEELGAALATIPEDAPERAALAHAEAVARERRGELREASEAYTRAARLDPRDHEAALAAARLLRGQGEWRASADLLREFVNAHPGGDAAGLASVLQQLGRLLAGPLEELEAALSVYRRAVEVDPERAGLRTALAELLSHLPAHAQEALERTREILAVEPERVGSLRAVLRVAERNADTAAVARGCAILEALGAATQRERDAAAPKLLKRVEPRLADPRFELVRAMLEAAAGDLGEALGVGATQAGPPAPDADPAAAFRHAAVRAEGRLTAAAVVPLETEALRETVTLLFQLALDAEGVSGDGNLVNALSEKLGRRTRRKLRRLLEGHILAEVENLDYEAWRDALRGLAGATALVDTGLPLRTALLATLSAEETETPSPADEADIGSLVAGSREARALLRRVVLGWADAIGVEAAR